MLYAGTGRSGECECDRFAVTGSNFIDCFIDDSRYCENNVCSRQRESWIFSKATDKLTRTDWCIWCDRNEDCALDGLVPTCFRGTYDSNGKMTNCEVYEALPDGKECNNCSPCQKPNGEWGMTYGACVSMCFAATVAAFCSLSQCLHSFHYRLS